MDKSLYKQKEGDAVQNRMFLYDPNGESILLELEQCEDSTVVHHLWENDVFLSSYNLPIYKDGYLFGYVSSLLTCIDASNGDLVWQIPNSDPGFFILVGNHLVIITQYGQLQIVKASPDGYQEIAQLDVLDHLDWSDTAWCHPSFANGHIFVRSLAEIARVKITPLGKNITSYRNQKNTIRLLRINTPSMQLFLWAWTYLQAIIRLNAHTSADTSVNKQIFTE